MEFWDHDVIDDEALPSSRRPLPERLILLPDPRRLPHRGGRALYFHPLRTHAVQDDLLHLTDAATVAMDWNNGVNQR